MSLDDQFSDQLRKEMLDARAGQQGMLSQRHVDFMHELWKIIAVSANMFNVDVHVSRTDHKKDIDIIKVTVLDRDEDKVREAMRLVGITKIRIRTNNYNTTWYSDPYRFIFKNLTNLDYPWVREPSWLEVTLVETQGVHDETVITITEGTDEQIRQALEDGGNLEDILGALPASVLSQITERATNFGDTLRNIGFTVAEFMTAMRSMQRATNTNAREQNIQALVREAQRMSLDTIVEAEVNTLVNNIRAAGLTLQEFQSEYLGQPFAPFQEPGG